MTETNVIQPTRIVVYDEGYGEWTIEATDDNGTCAMTSDGRYVACWLDHEAHDNPDEFTPLTLADAVAMARQEFAEGGYPADLPVYLARDGVMEEIKV
jgi:hypothetical protein